MKTRDFIASGFWVTIKYVFIAVSGIIISWGFAHLATKEIFGEYQFVLSLLSLFSIFTLPGLNTAALKAVSEKNPGSVIEAVEKSFRFSLLAVPFLLIYSGYLFSKGDHVLSLAILIGTCLFPFFYAPNTWYTYYEGQLYFRPVAIRTVLASFIVTIAVLLGLYFRLNIAWLVTFYLALSSLFSILFYIEIRWLMKKEHKQIPSSSLDLAYGKRVTAQKFVYTISESLPALSVSFILGHTSLALFQTANIFLSGVSGLIGALAAISLPQFFKETSASHSRLFWQNTIIGLLASIGYGVIVQLIFLRMYGEGYRQSFLLAQSLIALPFVISLRTFLVNYYTARDKNSLIIIVYIAANLIALGVFIVACQYVSFVKAASSYLYCLNILLFIPLFWTYFSKPKH